MIGGQRVGVVVPAAGRGRRMGGSRNKQFFQLAGKPIIQHTLEHVQSSDAVDVIVVAAEKDSVRELKELIQVRALGKVCKVVEGGVERQDSVWNGLQALRSYSVDLVIVHDAVRPFVTETLIRSVLDAALEDGAAIAAVPVKETVKRSGDARYVAETPKRENYWLVQTPQVFRFDLLYRAHEKARADSFLGTDDASLVERLGSKVRIVEGTYDNIKITTPEDLELAGLILQRWKRSQRG